MVKITDLTDKPVSGVSKATDGLGSIVSGVTNIDTTLGKIDNIFDKVLKIVDKIKPVQNQEVINVTPSPVQQERAMQQTQKPASDPQQGNQQLIEQFATPEGLKIVDNVLSQVEILKGPGCTIKELRAELNSFQNLLDPKTKKNKKGGQK